MESNRTVLITGASGFIGQALLKRLLRQRLRIIAGYRSQKIQQQSQKNKGEGKVAYLKLDLTKKGDFKKIVQKVDIVVHAGAQTFSHGFDKENSLEDLLNNILGTYNLLEFCREKDVKRIIYLSSKYIYGEPRRKKVDETHPAQPAGRFYGMGKLAGEHLCKRYSQDFGIKFLIFRLSSVFGKGQKGHFLIPRLIQKVGNNQQIRLYGDGTNIMEYLYIDDCVEIIAQTLDSHYEGIYNIGPGKALTLKELVGKILKVYSNSRPLPVHYEPRQNGPKGGFILDIEKAAGELRYKPSYNFEQGLNSMRQMEDM